MAALSLSFADEAWAKSKKKSRKQVTSLTAQSYVIVDMKDGRILRGKNPHTKLPPASTTKVMTALLALQYLPMDYPVRISQHAVNAAPSKAGLTKGAAYLARDLVKACLVSSSNDAAVALAEAVSGSEWEFASLMNQKARLLGMRSTKFINASGLPAKGQKQFTTAYDLTRLMREIIKDKRVDEMMAIVETAITGSDGRKIYLKAHNKMLWKKPKFVKGKTGWTFASRHTFVGTNYSSRKSFAFAMLKSQKPWADIERIATTGTSLVRGR